MQGIDDENIEAKMNLALDWIKYGNNVWIIYSTATLEKLMTRYKSLVEPEGRLFICEINIVNRKGWMNKGFWDWLKKKRDK
ncbi:hypothetical protein OI18_23375 [Flavihumibacter solisilvae]|uniref:Uncharacterized protein n=2 Tax=Flavihumibacter solisilvae TaxID=1349421 RepID=A0A0C1KRG0_9BACT|nr:hypothetical protein OI18_23375 [Flavihumibacter solisilvae]